MGSNSIGRTGAGAGLGVGAGAGIIGHDGLLFEHFPRGGEPVAKYSA